MNRGDFNNLDMLMINSDVVFNSLRLLTLISKFELKHTHRLTIDRLILYDFYLKFPTTMFDILDDNKYTFYEYYSYYHWKPARDKYHMYLRYLISRKLIERPIFQGDFCYVISPIGTELLQRLNSSYFRKIDELSVLVKQKLSKLSESKIEENILAKSLHRIKSF